MADLLLVDNDAQLVELLAWFLRQRGHAVRTAGSFADARTALAERPPELMLSDVDLGVESAVEELPRLASEGILPRTLVVSGYLDPGVQAVLERLEAVVGTLAKPFEYDELDARVRACLGLPTPVTGGGSGGGAPPSGVDRSGAPGGDEASVAGGGEGEDDDEGWIEIGPGPTPGGGA